MSIKTEVVNRNAQGLGEPFSGSLARARTSELPGSQRVSCDAKSPGQGCLAVLGWDQSGSFLSQRPYPVGRHGGEDTQRGRLFSSQLGQS